LISVGSATAARSWAARPVASVTGPSTIAAQLVATQPERRPARRGDEVVYPSGDQDEELVEGAVAEAAGERP